MLYLKHRSCTDISEFQFAKSVWTSSAHFADNHPNTHTLIHTYSNSKSIQTLTVLIILEPNSYQLEFLKKKKKPLTIWVNSEKLFTISKPQFSNLQKRNNSAIVTYLMGLFWGVINNDVCKTHNIEEVLIKVICQCN